MPVVRTAPLERIKPNAIDSRLARVLPSLPFRRHESGLGTASVPHALSGNPRHGYSPRALNRAVRTLCIGREAMAFMTGTKRRTPQGKRVPPAAFDLSDGL